MPKTAADQLQQLKALLPRGSLWDSLREEGKLFGELLAAIAEEFARIEAGEDTLLDEADPRKTLQLLQEYEEFAGLPDSCTGLGETLEQRHDALLAALVGQGGQSRQYFIDLANALGFPGATITEYDQHSVMSGVSAPIHLPEARFVWQLSAPAPAISMMTVMSGVSEGMGDQAPSTRLECAINKRKPAHTTPIFLYT